MKSVHRKARYGGQDNPRDQLRCMWMAIEGHRSNFLSGVTTAERFIEFIRNGPDGYPGDFFKDFRTLLAAMPEGVWDSPPFTPEVPDVG